MLFGRPCPAEHVFSASGQARLSASERQACLEANDSPMRGEQELCSKRIRIQRFFQILLSYKLKTVKKHYFDNDN